MAVVKGRPGIHSRSNRRFYPIFIWNCSNFQPSYFHRIYAAYGGVFIVMAMLGGWIFEGIAPDRFDLIGALITLVGVVIIFYVPR
tara:strand:- start:9425 stop:9679 length:255 start_codon:yes stop_codon:yes gene_type:complete